MGVKKKIWNYFLGKSQKKQFFFEAVLNLSNKRGEGRGKLIFGCFECLWGGGEACSVCLAVGFSYGCVRKEGV